MPEAVYLLIDSCLFFYIGSGFYDICLWLVVVIVAHEVVDGVLWKKFLEFLGKLGGKRFIMSKYESWSLKLLDNICHGKSLSGSSHTEECLKIISRLDRINELFYGFALVSGRGVRRVEFEHIWQSMDFIYSFKPFYSCIHPTFYIINKI